MSFGPKLEAVAVVPPRGEITATLKFIPRDENFAQEATLYVEEATGIRLLKIEAKNAIPEPTS